jgi:trehalose 6-phosphate synthase
MSRLSSSPTASPPSQTRPGSGGLAVAVGAALRERGGIWFGWSGKMSRRLRPADPHRQAGGITYATVDLTLATTTTTTSASPTALWPLFHYRLDLMSSTRAAAGYRGVNERLAHQLCEPLLRPTTSSGCTTTT